MTDQNDRRAEQSISDWLAAAPDRAPDRAVADTVDRLRQTNQPRMIVLRMSLPLAAAFVALTLVVGALAVGGATRPLWDVPAPTVSPSPSPECSIESAVGGQWPVVVGHGFAPTTDVVLDIDRANGQHAHITRKDRPELRTDENGKFGITLRPFAEDVGRGLMTAAAGCTASLVIEVTADQVPATCTDEENASAFNDGESYRAAVAADQPARWYHLDDNGDEIVDEIAGANGTRVGAISAFPVTGEPHSQLFDGIDSYIKIPAVTLDDFTVEAWVYLCKLASNRDAILGHGDGTPNINFFEDHPRLFTGDVADDAVIAETAASWTQWEHWVVTRDASATRIYLNGALDAAGPSYAGPSIFDQMGKGDAGVLDGMLDEVAIYDRALTADQIAAHYAASTSAASPSSTAAP